LIARPVACGPAALISISEGGLVAVVAVSDVQGLVLKGIPQRLDNLNVVDAAKGVSLAVVTGEVGHRGGGRPALEECFHLAVPVTIDEEDRAGVRADGADEPEAVFLGSAEGLLVGEDDAPIPGLKPKAREDQAATVRGAFSLELLVVEVEGGRIVSNESAVLAPAAQRFGRAHVTAAVLVVC